MIPLCLNNLSFNNSLLSNLNLLSFLIILTYLNKTIPLKLPPSSSLGITTSSNKHFLPSSEKHTLPKTVLLRTTLILSYLKKSSLLSRISKTIIPTTNKTKVDSTEFLSNNLTNTSIKDSSRTRTIITSRKAIRSLFLI